MNGFAMVVDGETLYDSEETAELVAAEEMYLKDVEYVMDTGETPSGSVRVEYDGDDEGGKEWFVFPVVELDGILCRMWIEAFASFEEACRFAAEYA